MIRRAKIVCTLGPVSRSQDMISRLARCGMDVVRLNLSHGTHPEHARTIETVREISRNYEKPMAVIADLQGPKIRTGALAGGRPVLLHTGQRFSLTTRDIPGDTQQVHVDYPQLPSELRKGDCVLLSDGLIELRVLSIRDGRDVVCEVVNGGELGEHKGINLPGVKVKMNSLTPKDYADLKFALEHDANYIAVSFVRNANDVRQARRAIRRMGKDTLIIAKLEKTEAIDNLEEILDVADGVMIARGDLGVEMKPEKVPMVQKFVIERARVHHLPVITATQMLGSMTRTPRPTRAEASDVANAVLDGTSALMLSEETATGRYPCESVIMMDRIIREAEANFRIRPVLQKSLQFTVAEAISEAVCGTTPQLGLKVIAVFTETGKTARLISHYRPQAPIIALSPIQETRRRLSLLWGVLPRKIRRVRDIDDLAAITEQKLLEERVVRKGDIVGIVAGTPLGIQGTTNLLKLHKVGYG